MSRSIDRNEADLLRRLHAGDVTAPAELAERYLESVQRSLAASFARTDEQAVTTAAIDAILSVARRPGQVDLSKGSLAGYLVMSARGDLRNALRTLERRHRRETSLDAVEVPVLERKIHRDDPNADPTADDAIRAADVRANPVDIRRIADDRADAAVLRAMLEGERRTAVYAEILGIASLDPSVQRAEVKKVKDRLKLRLKRARGRRG